jgi:hypothetical protein
VGQQAIDAFKTNNSFSRVGIALRDDKPSIEMCARAAERLGEVIANGDLVMPLEDEISKTAQKKFGDFLQQFGSLGEKLRRLNVPGQQRVEELLQALKDVLANDASDATQRMGAEDSSLYNNLKWAAEVKAKLDHGMEGTLKELDEKCQSITRLPQSGIPGDLRAELAEPLEQLKQRLNQEDFYKHQADLTTTLSNIKTRVADAAEKMSLDIAESLKASQEDLVRSPGWDELEVDTRSDLLGQLEQFDGVTSKDIKGIEILVGRSFDITQKLKALQKSIKETTEKRRLQRELEKQEKQQKQIKEKEAGKYVAKVFSHKLSVPKHLKAAQDIDALINQLQQLKQELHNYDELDITFELLDSNDKG